MNITVIGAGLMGHGIAQVFARAGHQTVLTDPNPAVLGVALSRVQANLLAEGVDARPVLGRLRVDSDFDSAVAQADLVVEAVPEKLVLKQELFARVTSVAPAHAVLASNTSVIPITQIGEKLSAQARSRLLGTHWWNPPHLVPLVEVVRTAYTSETVFEQTFACLAAAGKCPVRVQHDVAGFIGNRLQHALWREAIALVEAGVCDAEAIDLVVKNSFGMRMPVLGPMENADLVGLELTRDVHCVMFPELHCDKSASPLLTELINQGCTGMQAGQGLRSWTQEQAHEVHSRLAAHLLRMTATAKALR